MSGSVKFLLVQLKKMTKVLPSVFLVSALSCICVGFLFTVFFAGSGAREEKQNYGVAIVGNLEESYLGFGVQAIRTLDDSRYVIDFLVMTEKGAREAFIADEITGIIIIPDGLVEALVYGRNDVKVKYIVSDGQKGITNILMEEFAKIASTLITHSQAGVFGLQEVMRQEGMYDIFHSATDELNMKYINLVLSRTEICGVEELGVSNGLSMMGYLGCGILIFVLILLGITYSPVFARRKIGLARVYKSKGVCESIQVLGEYLAYFLMVLICVAGIALLAGLILMTGILPIDREESVMLLLRGFGKLIPVILFLTAMQFLFYEIVSGVVSSVLIQFVLGIGMCYVSGCFYPAGFFPDVVQVVGGLLPTGVAMKYLSGCILEEVSTLHVLGMSLYLVVFIAASIAVRHYKIRKG